MVTKDSPSHLTSETAAQQHMQQTLNRTQVNIPPPKKNEKQKKNKRFNPQMRLLTTWGPSRIQSLKTQKKKPWKLDPMRGRRAFFNDDR